MKKYSIMLAVAAVFAAASCAKEAPAPEEIAPAGEQTQTTEEQTLTNPITITFSANAETKVSLVGEGTSGAKTAVWDEGDQVKIIWYNTAESTPKDTTVTVASHGTAYTTFTARVEEADYYYAVYPATLEYTLAGDEENSEFVVKFDNNKAYTDFKSAARYAARTTRSSSSFTFVPISTVIRFKVDDNKVRHVWFRFMDTDCQLRGDVTIAFSHNDKRDADIPTVSNSGSGATYNSPVPNSGTYYMTLPANNATDSKGFVMRVRESSDSWRPAAYYGNVITLAPGKLYNLTTAVDSKNITDYYVAPDGSAEKGDPTEANFGTSPTNPAEASWVAKNIGVFKYPTAKAAPYILNGVTIHLMGSDTAFTSPLSSLFPTATGSEDSYSYTIQGGEGEGTTTFTTSASSLFNNAKASIIVSNITFSGCTVASAVNVSAGTISFDACKFSSNTATNGGAVTVGSDSASDSNLRVRFSNTIFNGNSASSGNGGAVYVVEKSTGGVVSFNNCLFEQNTANSAGKSGGAAYENNGSTALLFNNCSFTGINAASNGIVIYINNAKGRLGMNNCTINGGSANKINGALVTNKGLSIISNSSFWSKDGYGAWGLIALGASGTQNGSSIVNCLVRNGTETSKWPAFACNTNYYQNVQWCVYTGAKGVGSSPANVVSADKHTFANCWDLGLAQGQTINNSPTNATNATYGNKKIDGVTQYYYAWTNDLAAAGFTKPTRDQIRNLIAKTAESTNDAKDGFGKLFLNWLDEVGGLDTDIKGASRPEDGFKPGSAE